jgi:hypothetical protein
MSDPLGLEAEMAVYRTSRTSQSSVFVYENGKFLGAFFGNQGTFAEGRRGPPDGTYFLKPKNNWEEGDVFAPGTPSITGDGLQPGVPIAGDPAVFRVHPEGPSRGCLTAPLDWANRIWDIMDRNLDTGGTTIRYETGSAPKAIPNRQPKLRAPTAHKWWW